MNGKITVMSFNYVFQTFSGIVQKAIRTVEYKVELATVLHSDNIHCDFVVMVLTGVSKSLDCSLSRAMGDTWWEGSFLRPDVMLSIPGW
jgi:hypothetical protein